ncbi:hypothetical protein [Flammeovirga pacifica]|uniref:Uncharacterized protein n=1 Tax=Flammeovirga pacifica TaxID=915059 RepID=A0A1S1Z2K0_FLAPC|nr:hypothetical protein [Flammeovirga pacifica]OHX67447.1 hypothetical protein NH26_14390 [Flammeovirga pacifica]
MHKKIKYLIYSFLAIGFLLFIQGFITGFLGFGRNYKKCTFINEEGKKVILFGIKHIESENYYKSLTNEFDSLNQLGYTLFYEQMKINTKNCSLQQEKIEYLLNQHSIERYKRIAFFLDLEA